MIDVDRFVFNAGTDAPRLPVPAVSPEAEELLLLLSRHALQDSPRLGRLEHRLHLAGEDAAHLDGLLAELLASSFPLPVEGGEQPIGTIARAHCDGRTLSFALDPIYAAYLISIGVGAEREGRRTFFVTDEELEVLGHGLNALHDIRGSGWTFHAAHALASKSIVASPAAFRLRTMELLLSRLGTAPWEGSRRTVVVTDTELEVLVEGLKVLRDIRATAWTLHATHALAGNAVVAPPEAFRLTIVEQLLSSLGAVP